MSTFDRGLITLMENHIYLGQIIRPNARVKQESTPKWELGRHLGSCSPEIKIPLINQRPEFLQL